MQNPVLSSAERTGWKDHHTNVNWFLDHDSLSRDNTMNSIGHILISDKANDKVCIIIEERLLLHHVLLQKGRWRVGDSHIDLGGPMSTGELHFRVHKTTPPSSSLSL